MARLSVFACVAALCWNLAESACPNQCSGHGVCDDSDRCICYKAPGTKGFYRDAWIGGDCSQRVCPYGDSFDVISDKNQALEEVHYGSFKLSSGSSVTVDSTVGFIPADPTSKAQPKLKAFLNNGFIPKRDIGVDVKVVSIDLSLKKLKFQWKLSNQRTFNAEVETPAFSTSNDKYFSRATAYHIQTNAAVTAAATTAAAAKDTGLFIYWDVDATTFVVNTQTVFPGDWYYLNVTYNEGKRVISSDQNTHHPQIECSGRGTCDRARGSCQCLPGYTGDACQRTTCANDCSGHGTCQSLKNFAEDSYSADAITYATAVDAVQQYGCKCDAGFRGADCAQMECPSGADPLGGDGAAQGRDCSGRGTCNYSTGTCECYKGFNGERCELQNTYV